MATKKVWPRPGYKIDDPQLHDSLPPEGREVAFDEYWARRLRDGDVLDSEPTADERAAADATRRALLGEPEHE